MAVMYKAERYDQADEILARLTPKKQIEVVRRIANMEQTKPDIIKELYRRFPKTPIPAIA